MGYTHYFEHIRPFTDDEWRQVCEGSRAVLDYCRDQAKIPLCLRESPYQPPDVSQIAIRFNGQLDDGREPFVLEKDPAAGPLADAPFFNFCKTADKPYDLAVCLVLLVVADRTPGVLRISSDGRWDGEWVDARAVYLALFGKPAVCPWHESGSAADMATAS